MASLLDITRKYRRSLQWITGILVTYSLIGFLLLPWLAERQVTSLLRERLQLETEIESLYLNPFTFYTELDGLNIAQLDGSPLVSLQNFSADLQFTRLLLLQVRLNDIALSGLDLHLTRESETTNTLSVLAERWQASQPADDTPQAAEQETPGELFPVTIDLIQLSTLNVHVSDQVPDDGFSGKVSLESATLASLSTIAGDQGSMGTHDIVVTINDTARLQTSGNFSLVPMLVEGNLSLNEFQLAPFSTYVRSALPVGLDDGSLQLAFDYNADLSQQELQLSLTAIDVVLESLSLSSPETASSFLQLGSLSLEQGTVRLPDNNAALAGIAVNELQIAANRDVDGSVDLQRLLSGLTDTTDTTSSDIEVATQTPNDPEPTPWTVSIERLQLNNNQLSFTDRALRTEYTRQLSLNLSVSDIDNQPGTPFPFELSLGLDSGGTGTLQGDLTVLPDLSVETVLTLDGIELNAVAPFLAEYTTLNLQNGELNSTLAISTNTEEPLALDGDLSINELLLIDTQRDAQLLSLPTLQADSLRYSVANNSAELSELLLSGLDIRVIINEDGTTNLGQSVSSSNSTTTDADDPASASSLETESQSSPEATQTAQSALPSITLGRISLENAAMDFTDRNLPFEFNANVQELNADINNISNTTSELTQFTLEGRVGEFGLMQLDAELDPFNFANAATIDLRFSNIDLPGATPYAIKFAGREVDDGTIGLRLEYTLENQQLVANNRMTLNDLVLGEEIEYPDAMDLPLDLALALLKDSNGVIEFEVPVSGELNDPEFDLGPAIRRAIGNILTNIVAAPFRLLGSLVGAGADANIDQVRFQPGRADIAAPERQKLLQLGEALTQRPELLLEIPLLQGGESDRLALQTAAVDSRLEQELANSAESELSLVERRTAILETFYSATDASQTLEEIRALHTTLPAPEATGQDGTSTAGTQDSDAPQFDVIAYNNDLYDRIVSSEPIGEAELASLALERIANITEFLVTNASMSSERVIQGEPASVEVDEEGWLVMEFGLGSK